MRKTRLYEDVEISRIAVNTDQLRAILSCGRATAEKIGEAAGAKIKIGKRTLWNAEKVRRYLSEISRGGRA